MFTVAEIKTQIQDLIGVDSTDTTVAARLLRWINNARRVMYRERDWDALKAYYQLNRTPDYTTGTVSISQDARVVTGVGTVFTAKMVGRYIQFSTQSEWYRIVSYTAAGTIGIESDFVAEDQSGVSYVIRKVFYRVPAAVRKLKNVGQFAYPRVISEQGDRQFLKSNETYQSSTGSPDKYQLAGTWDKSTAYTTGDVTGTLYGTVLTGDSTVWMDEVLPGDVITIASQKYGVKSVESDTKMTLYAGLKAAAINAAYSVATNPDSWIVRFDSQASARGIIPIEYYQAAYDLLNDTDSDFFIRRHPEMVIEGAAIWEKRAQEDESWVNDYQKWVAQIQGSFGETASDATFAPDFTSPEYE